MTDHFTRPTPSASAAPAGAAVRRMIEGFLRPLMPTLAPGPMSDDTALLGPGGLDSLGVVQLMVFLGSELGIDVADEDFTEENLASLGQLQRFVARKAGEGKAA